jgi:hypothetical protein
MAEVRQSYTVLPYVPKRLPGLLYMMQLLIEANGMESADLSSIETGPWRWANDLYA